MARKSIVRTSVYQMMIDSDGMEKGMLKGKRALNLARREMSKMLSPTERAEIALEKLGIAAKNNPMAKPAYQRKLKEYNKLIAETARRESALGKGRALLNSKAGGIVGVLGAGAVLANVNRQIDRVDKLSKVSDNLGISLEALTRIQFTASKVSGLSADQTSKAIEKMVRRVSEAAQGTGEAQSVIKEIGLDAQELARSKPEQAFFMIARAMDKVTNEGDRVRIATKLFDDEQARIHTTLALTNEELQKQFQISDNLGNTLNAVDASKMVAAKDAMTEMASAFDAFSTQFAVHFLPGLTKALEAVNKFLEKNYGDGKAAGLGSALWEAADVGIGDSFGDSIKKRGVAGTFLRAPASLFGVASELYTGDIQRRNEREAASRSQRMFEQQQFDARRTDRQSPNMFSRLFDASRRSNPYASLAQLNYSQTAKPLDTSVEARRRRLFGEEPQGNIFTRLAGALGSYGATAQAPQVATRSIDPMASVSAGSSEAFKILNRTQVKTSVEAQIANKQLTELKTNNTELREIRKALVNAPRETDAAGI